MSYKIVYPIVGEVIQELDGVYFLEHTPVDASSLRGTIFIDEDPVQLLFVDYIHETPWFSAALGFSAIDPNALTYVKSGIFNSLTGEITITWSKAPIASHLIVSYDMTSTFETYREVLGYFNLWPPLDLDQIHVFVDGRQIDIIDFLELEEQPSRADWKREGF